MSELTLTITPAGVQSIYDDAHRDIYDQLGAASIRRASHVEPNAQGDWEADLSPVGGPTLGPFVKRADALAAEVAWLNEHHL